MKTVSVIIPVYNREELIERSVRSVLDQTYPGLKEVIVVDDCSTDRSAEIVKSIDDLRIRYVKAKKNSGAGPSRNLGIELAEGDLIAFQDSDDYWLPEKLEKVAAYQEETDADMIFHAFLFKDLKNGVEARMPGILFPQGRISYDQLLPDNKAGTPTFVMKKECAKANRFNTDMPSLEDWELALRLCMDGYKVYFLNEVLLVAEVQDDSKSRNYEKLFEGLNKIFFMTERRQRVDRETEADEKRALEARLAAEEVKNRQQQEQIDRLTRECDEHYRNALKATSDYQQILQTTSWKITKPLRTVQEIVHKRKD